jgi:hypothetical protein
MRIKEIHALGFKRFTDLRICKIPETTRLVVLLGVNGTGKTCVFEALNYWRKSNYFDYYHKKYSNAKLDTPQPATRPKVTVTFHSGDPTGEARKRAIYLRSAYRNEPHFQVNSVSTALPKVEDEEMRRLDLLVNDDKRVQQNYNRLFANTVYDLFNSPNEDEETTRKKLREVLIGPLRQSMQRVFGDLVLQGLGNPQQGGTFLFEKGMSKGFPYINLSAGEKDAFDVLLDVYLRKGIFTDSVYCIDEPGLHLHSKLQARLLNELFNLMPPNSQLWIATHSIGMIREAIEIQRDNPDSVVFLDFSDRDYDHAVEMRPVKVDRLFWKKFLSVALDDMANLVAPKRIVLCEGRPLGTKGTPSRQEYDAKCLRRIFAREFPDTEFISGGNSDDVVKDSIRLIASLERVVTGVECIRIIDRDGRTDEEIAELEKQGVRVLTRRHLESYLLDDEVLEELCKQHGKPEKFEEVKRAKELAIESARKRGKDKDDAKAAAGEFFNAVKGLLEIENPGSNWEAFFSTFMADACQSRLHVYEELKRDIFGEPRS